MTFINYDGVVSVTVEEDMYDILGDGADELLSLSYMPDHLPNYTNPYMTHSLTTFVENHLNYA